MCKKFVFDCLSIFRGLFKNDAFFKHISRAFPGYDSHVHGKANDTLGGSNQTKLVVVLLAKR